MPLLARSRPVRMNLLLDAISPVETSGDPSDVEVVGVEHDSRRVRPGDLFCCLPGRLGDGHDHAAEAVARGAVGVVCERPLDDVPAPVVVARVPPSRARPAMAQLAAAFWGHPARQLEMVGVTGTNGKTTVAHLLGAVLGSEVVPATVLGTLSGARTTPEAPDLQRTLAQVRDRYPGDRRPAVAMEVSSHALVQSRVDGIRFDAAVFTNLSHDHLDFHHTMEEYFAAKASLFTPERAIRGVVWSDDEWGRRLLGVASIPTTPVRADQASDVRVEPGRTSFAWRGLAVSVRLTGAVNVRNALLAAETAVALGRAPDDVAAALSSAGPVPGRMEVVATPGAGGPPFTVLVDYAHTPAGLEVVLTEARRLAGGRRVAAVFGCGGDRDRAKRPLMGAAAVGHADLVVVTTDNPRHEDPAAILDEVVDFTGAEEATSSGSLSVEPDREAAIERAVRWAGPGDVVVIAGKGHETVMEIADERLPFDDVEVARRALARLLGRS